MKNIVVKASFTVPIYDVVVRVFVAQDVKKVFNRLAHVFKEKPSVDDFGALCVSDEASAIGLFFYATDLTDVLIAHEISHAVDFTLEMVGHKCPHCAEPRAYLNGYITKRVRAIFAKRKIKIQRS